MSELYTTLITVSNKTLLTINSEGVHFVNCTIEEQAIGAYNFFERCTFKGDVVLDFCRFESCNFNPEGMRKQTLKHSSLRNCKLNNTSIPDESITKKNLVLPDGSNALDGLFVRRLGPIPPLS